MPLSQRKPRRLEVEDVRLIPQTKRIEKFCAAGVVCSLQFKGIKIKDWPTPFYTPFRTQKPADISLTLRYSKTLPQPSAQAKMLFDGQTHWQFFDEGDHYLMKLFESKDLSHNRTALISKDLSKAEIVLSRRTWKLDRVLRPFLEILFVNYLASRGGFLLHGAAVRDGRHAYLFVGESGAGKTTMSQFWAYKEGDISVLGDERTLVRREKDGWFVYGSPWPGLGFIVANERVPISHIFLIRHGREKHEVIPQPKPFLFQKLFTQVFSSFWDYESVNQISETCGTLIEEIPCLELASLKESSVTDFVRNFVNQK